MKTPILTALLSSAALLAGCKKHEPAKVETIPSAYITNAVDGRGYPVEIYTNGVLYKIGTLIPSNTTVQVMILNDY